MDNSQGNSHVPQSTRYYTYMLNFSFRMQHTFTETDVEQAEEGGENDLDPTDEALANLENEIREVLSQDYVVESLDAFTDFSSLLGVEDGTP